MGIWLLLIYEIARYGLDGVILRVMLIGVHLICAARFVVGREHAGVMALRWIHVFERFYGVQSVDVEATSR
jgi:hypothetical protein